MGENTSQHTKLQREPFRLGDARVEPALLRVTTGEGRVTELSRRQMVAIVELAEHHGTVVPRARLHEILCMAREGLRDRGALSHHIGIIRRAFGDSSSNPTFIKTIRGQGYCLLQEPVTAARGPAEAEASVDALPPDQATPSPSPSPRPWAVAALIALATILLVPTSAWLRSQDETDDPEGRAAAAPADDAILLEALHAAASSGHGEASEQALTLRLNELRSDALTPPQTKSTQLVAIGRALMCLRKWELASEAFDQALVIQRAQHDAADPLLLAKVLTGVAQIDMIEGGSLDDARPLLDEAERRLADSEASEAERARLWGAHAALMEFGEDLPQAEALLARAVSAVVDAGDLDPSLRLQLQTGRARLLTRMAEYADATSLTAAVLKDGRAYFGPSDRRLTPALSQHGFLLAEQGLHESAVATYATVVRILEEHYPDTNAQLAYARMQMAESLEEMGDPHAAAMLYADMIERVPRTRHDDFLRISNLRLLRAKALIGAEEPQEAADEIQKVRRLIVDGSPLPDWMRYKANSLYGAALVELGDCRQGMRWLDDAVEAMAADGVEDPRITANIHARRQHYRQTSCTSTVQRRAALDDVPNG